MKLCKNCEYLHGSAKEHLRYWLCVKHPIKEVNYLDPDRLIWEPYERCYKVNTDGSCPDYERKVNEA